MADSGDRSPYRLKLVPEEEPRPIRLAPDPSAHAPAEEEVARLLARRGVSTRPSSSNKVVKRKNADSPDESLEREWSRTRTTKLRLHWVILITLASLIIIIGAVFVARERSASPVAQVEKEEAIPSSLLEAVDEQREARQMVDELYRALEGYFGASSIGERLRWVRHPERVGPLMEEWRESEDLEPRELQDIEHFEPVELEGKTFWAISCQVSGENDKQTLLVEEMDDGTILVDWETAVCHQPMPWDEFVRQRPEGEALDFRIYAESDAGGLYSHEFADEEKWQGYRLTSRDSVEYMIGYAERGSEVHQTLKELLDYREKKIASVVARLRIPAGAEAPRSVLIEEIISEQWAIVDGGEGGDGVD